MVEPGRASSQGLLGLKTQAILPRVWKPWGWQGSFLQQVVFGF